METNPITPEIHAIRESIDTTVHLSDPRLAKITRLRLVSDPGFPMWDLSYCYGELEDGRNVRVSLPQHQFKRQNLKGQLIKMCADSGVFGKGLGILDDSVISTLV